MDFIHIGNRAFGGKCKNYSTNAFTDDEIIGMSISCDKYFPDLVFPWHGKVYMVEFGVKDAHKERKEKQQHRMSYWRDIGGCLTFLITDISQVNDLVDALEMDKPHYLT